MEQGVKSMVEWEVKAIKLHHCCMVASTPGVVHSTEAMEEYMAEMAGWLVGNGTEV